MRAWQHSGYCHAEGISADDLIQQRAVERPVALQQARRRMQQPELLDAESEFVDELFAFALRTNPIGHVPVDADHANRPSVSAADGLPHAVNGANRAVCPLYPEVGAVAVAAERGFERARGVGQVFGHEAP